MLELKKLNGYIDREIKRGINENNKRVIDHISLIKPDRSPTNKLSDMFIELKNKLNYGE